MRAEGGNGSTNEELGEPDGFRECLSRDIFREFDNPTARDDRRISSVSRIPLRVHYPVIPVGAERMSIERMSMKHANPAERLIVALDVSTKAEAQRIVGSCDGLVTFYKVGFQLFIAEGMAYVRELIERGNKVFLDLKMDDVEETITSAVREITRSNVHLLTLHGGGATARAAVAGRGASEFPKVLSVTLLSSLDGQDLIDVQILGPKGRFPSLMEYVLWRADQAVQAGCDGLIASGETIGEIRKRLGPDPLIISPGIRPSGTTADDHKRAATPAEAIAAGADYLVVGRPIRNAADPAEMARRIIGDIEQAYQTRT